MKTSVLLFGCMCFLTIHNSYSQSGWFQQNSGYPDINFQSAYFVNAATGWAIGGNGTILSTSNGGANWTAQTSGTAFWLFSVNFPNTTNGWAVGIFGTILKTTNGGITFIKPISTELPDKIQLFQNYPNPFNPVTKIKFDITSDMKYQTANVKIIIYDVLGKEVSILVNEQLKPGTYETSIDGSKLSSGVYFYKLITKEFSETRRMLLVK
ncbi:MAG: T9SS type A sorting domain-containing protein [Ignavibacteria bacterium]|jgi:hypothetical protein